MSEPAEPVFIHHIHDVEGRSIATAFIYDELADGQAEGIVRKFGEDRQVVIRPHLGQIEVLIVNKGVTFVVA